MYDYVLEDNQKQSALAYDAYWDNAESANTIEWNGTLFPYTIENGEIYFDYQVILGYEWEMNPNPGEDNEWYFFQEHCWKTLGKPEQIVDCTFPFLAFEEPEPQELEDIPIEHF